jgi:hypothetical protein
MLEWTDNIWIPLAEKTLPLLTNCLANTYNSTMYHITPKHDYAIHIISDQRFTFIANLISQSIRKTLKNPYINSWVTEFVNKVCVIQKCPLISVCKTICQQRQCFFRQWNCIMSVLIAGSSHVRRLHDYVEARHACKTLI